MCNVAFISRKTARARRELVRFRSIAGCLQWRARRRRAGNDRWPSGGRDARHITLLISLIHTIVQSRCFILYFHTLVLVDTPADDYD